MRWDIENKWQLRHEFCNSGENTFMAGAEESLYIKYTGDTVAKLIICEEECEFVDRSVFVNFCLFSHVLFNTTP